MLDALAISFTTEILIDPQKLKMLIQFKEKRSQIIACT